MYILCQENLRNLITEKGSKGPTDITQNVFEGQFECLPAVVQLQERFADACVVERDRFEVGLLWFGEAFLVV